MKKLMQLSLSLTLSVLFASCSHVEQKEDNPSGPVVTGCVIDTPNGNFLCATPDKTFALKREDAQEMLCIHPKDTEELLKACKLNNIIIVPVCTVTKESISCADSIGRQFSLDFRSMDNYFCLSAKDRKRVFDRCSPSKV